MNIAGLLSKWKEIINRANDRGIPLCMVRDPNTLEGSVSLTLVVISSALVSIGIIGKWSGSLGGIDINNALQFFYASSTLYFGHSWVHKEPKDDQEANAKVDDPDKK